MSLEKRERVQLLVCRMLKGDKEFRASVVKTKGNEVKEIFFESSKNISSLGEKIFNSKKLKKENFEIKNNGVRCKKSKTTNKTRITKCDCGRIKNYEFELFFAATTGQVLV